MFFFCLMVFNATFNNILAISWLEGDVLDTTMSKKTQ